jgi:hypothetical protein
MTFLPTENIDLRENLPRFEALAVAVAVVDDKTIFFGKGLLVVVVVEPTSTMYY